MAYSITGLTYLFNLWGKHCCDMSRPQNLPKSDLGVNDRAGRRLEGHPARVKRDKHLQLGQN